MNGLDEMTKNHMQMQKIKKTYNRVTIVYVSICLPYAIISIISGIMIQEINFLGVLFDTFILKAGVITCGFLSCYKHKNIFAVLAALFQHISAQIDVMDDTFIDLLIGGISFNLILFIIVTITCIFTIIANKKYEYLQDQYGFPHFNERFIMQEEEKKQNAIKDKYQINYERIIKNSSEEMGDLDTNFPDNSANGSNYFDDEDKMDII